MTIRTENRFNTQISPAEIEWNGDNQLISLQFSDIYFSDDDGVNESRYVFLTQNDLPQRWSNCREFTIIEAGFGSGLNFLVTWQSWHQHAPPEADLRYISVEKFPIKKPDLETILLQWPGLERFGRQLLDHYPDLTPGLHELEFDDPTVRLTLLFDDINTILSHLKTPADAWFLDGFNPACNPDMWSDTLFRAIPRLTKPGGTFATYTSAGFVKRGLRSNGFHVERIDGYGRKRHMLRGYLEKSI